MASRLVLGLPVSVAQPTWHMHYKEGIHIATGLTLYVMQRKFHWGLSTNLSPVAECCWQLTEECFVIYKMLTIANSLLNWF